MKNIGKISFDILNCVDENNSISQVELAARLFRPEENISKHYTDLVHGGFLSRDGVTKKGKDYLEEHRIDNAIILAAGMSTRFVPFNYEMPKGLLEVKGEVLVERQIRQLLEKGIEEIVVVVGYMKEKFEYLKDKYGVILVETTDYA